MKEAGATHDAVTASTARNWPLRASLFILASIAILCLFGPLVSGHPYDQVYRDYVLAGPSLFAHPDAAEVDGAIAAIARHRHVHIEAARDGETM
ncbi:MAG TPA: hypothetical protein VMU78_04185, partial [Methylocella sp.]|nr:hypothetical protein [Methylocella sp.]